MDRGKKEGEGAAESQAAGYLVHLLTLWTSDPALLKIETPPGSQLDQPDTVCIRVCANVFAAGDSLLLKESYWWEENPQHLSITWDKHGVTHEHHESTWTDAMPKSSRNTREKGVDNKCNGYMLIGDKAEGCNTSLWVPLQY